MPSERFVEALNEQIVREFAAAHQYVAVETYYAAGTFPRLAHFFHEQAEEEREHAMKMVNYLIDTSSEVRLGEIRAPRRDFADHVEPIRIGLEQERETTVRISELLQVARDAGDYASEQFMHWFVEEQVEEEAEFQDLLAVAERTREIPMLLEEYLARDQPGRRESE